LLIRQRYLVSVRGAVMRQRHDHLFGDVRERDRHQTMFGEATIRAAAGASHPGGGRGARA
jgi:iron complex outermembrane receptor protein